MSKNLKKLLKIGQRKLSKYNLVDLIGIGIFFLILVSSVFILLRQPEYVKITMRISQSDSLDPYSKPPVWYLSYIKPGLAAKDGLGRDVIRINDVYTFHTTDSNKNTYIDMEIRAAYNKRTGEYTYNGVTLLVGSYQTFKLKNIQITGVISALGNTLDHTTEKELVVYGYLNPQLTDEASLAGNSITDGIRNYVADKFIPGLEIQDNKQQVLAQVLSVNKTPATRHFAFQDKFVAAEDPERTKVELKMSMKVKKIGDVYFFREVDPIVIGNTFQIEFGTFNAPFTITNIENQ